MKRINTVAVLGLGTMGHGIAQTFAAAGLSVRCFDEARPVRDSLADRVRANLKQFRDAGLIDADGIEPTVRRLAIHDSESAAVDGAEFVVEAVREDLEIKQALFARVEKHVDARCILASNTSTFPMTRIAAGLRRPERALDTHWFNPPHICPLVEVVPGERTDPQTVDATMALHERIGKMPVRLNSELPGFLINRIQVAMVREVFDLMDRGVASPEDIDRAVRCSMGLRLAAVGPLGICDFAGLDIYSRVYDGLVKEIRSDTELPDGLRERVERGQFGFKTGRGIFDHPPDGADEELAQRDRDYLELLKILRARRERP